jgi:hypothetical protein
MQPQFVIGSGRLLRRHDEAKKVAITPRWFAIVIVCLRRFASWLDDPFLNRRPKRIEVAKTRLKEQQSSFPISALNRRTGNRLQKFHEDAERRVRIG